MNVSISTIFGFIIVQIKTLRLHRLRIGHEHGLMYSNIYANKIFLSKDWIMLKYMISFSVSSEALVCQYRFQSVLNCTDCYPYWEVWGVRTGRTGTMIKSSSWGRTPPLHPCLPLLSEGQRTSRLSQWLREHTLHRWPRTFWVLTLNKKIAELFALMLVSLLQKDSALQHKQCGFEYKYIVM